jgi:hypothetical protein
LRRPSFGTMLPLVRLKTAKDTTVRALTPFIVTLCAAAGAALGCSSSSSSPPLSCSGCSVTGTWYGDYSRSTNRQVFQVEIVQNGDALQGTIASSIFSSSSQTAIEGTQKDGAIRFGDIDGLVTFDGTTDGREARGSYTAPSLSASGSWVASRIVKGTVAATSCFHANAPNGLTHDGTAFWYVSVSDGTVRRVDAGGTELKAFHRPDNVAGGDPKLAYDGHDLWMGDFGSITVFDTDGNVKSHTDFNGAPTPSGAPAGINALARMNGVVWAVSLDGRLTRITETGAAQETVFLPVTGASAIVHDGQNLWAAPRASGNTTQVYRLDASTRVTAVYALARAGAGASSVVSDLAFDGRSVWAAFSSSDEICPLQFSE